jgi:hypothetical protein
VTDTGGFAFLIAWAIFAALLVTLGLMIVYRRRGH